MTWQLRKPPAENWEAILEPSREWESRAEFGQFLFICSSVRYEQQREEVTVSLQSCFPPGFYLLPLPPNHSWDLNSSPSTTQLSVQCMRKIVRSGICYLTFSIRMIFKKNKRKKENIYNKKRRYIIHLLQMLLVYEDKGYSDIQLCFQWPPPLKLTAQRAYPNNNPATVCSMPTYPYSEGDPGQKSGRVHTSIIWGQDF